MLSAAGGHSEDHPGQLLMDTPIENVIDITLSVIGSYSTEGSVGDTAVAASQAWTLTSAWPAANRAIHVPIYIPSDCVLQQMFWENGATVSGNVDVGIFNKYGDRLSSAGSTVMAGASTIQTVDITNVELWTGTYYISMAVDNTTATFQRAAVAANQLRVCGVQEMASAFPLPNPITFGNPSSAYLPKFGLTLNTVI